MRWLRQGGTAAAVLLVGAFSGCLPIPVLPGAASRADVQVRPGPVVPETNLLSLRVACTGQAPSDECSPIAVIPRGETRYVRIAGTFDPATTTFAIPGMTTASPVYARVEDTDIVTFVLTVPEDAAPGIYNVYAQGPRGMSVLSGALEVVP